MVIKMNKKLLVLVIIGILAIGVGSLTLTGNTIQKQQPIKVGFIGPLTGTPSLWGLGAKNLVELAVDEINQNSGVNGRMLEPIYEDGKCNPKDAVNSANKLIQVDQVKFILGGHCSPETTAIVPIVDKNKVFLLAGITSSDGAVDGSDYAFRTSPPTIENAEKISEIAIKKYKTTSMLTEQAAYAKSMSIDVKKSFEKLGGKVLSEDEYPPEQTDFRTQLLKIKEKNPDSLFFSPQTPNSAVLILKQMKELNMKMPVFSNTIPITKEVYNLSDKGFDETAFSVTPYADKTKRESEELNKKYKGKFGTEIPYNFFYVASTYDAVYMLKEALAKCGEDSECVKDYFKTIDYKGITINFRFKENGDPYFNSWAEMRVVNGELVLTPI